MIERASEFGPRWVALLAKTTDPSPFLQPVFLEGIERITGWNRVVVDVPETGLACLFIRSRGPVRDVVLPPFCPYTALLPEAAASSPDWTALTGRGTGLPANRLISLTPAISGPESSGYRQPADTASAEVIARQTYHLSTAPLEDALSSWSASPRRTWRKHANEFEFRVHPNSAAEEAGESCRDVIVELTELVKSGYARNGRRFPLEPSDLANWAVDLVDAGLAQLYSLYDRDKGTLAAGVVALKHQQMAWYWLAGSVPGPAMTVLMGYLQDDLHRQGIPVLDLMGANTPSIAEFKRRFGGELTPYLHIRTSTLAGSLIDQAAHAVRKMLS